MPDIRIPITRDVNIARRDGDDDTVVLLLHGYQQSGGLIHGLLQRCFPESWTVIAPDAPFPVIHRHESGLHMGFTWYFYDTQRDVYLLDMTSAVEYLMSLVHQLDLAGRPLRIVGYSQGGYLAPFVALELPTVQQVIGVSCRFRDEALDSPADFRLDGIHGAADRMVDPIRAQTCHRRLTERGWTGDFYTLDGCGHGVSGPVRDTLKRLLRT